MKARNVHRESQKVAMKAPAKKRVRLGERAAETLRRASERAPVAPERATEAATQWTQDAVEYGRHNPLLTSLLVFSAGIGLGCWLGSERRSR